MTDYETTHLMLLLFAALLTQLSALFSDLRFRGRTPVCVLHVLLLLANIIVLASLQLCHDTSRAVEVFGLRFSIAALWFAGSALLLFCAAATALGRHRQRRTLSNTSVRSSLDNLPDGVCFFDGDGLPVLCNRRMYSLAYSLIGRDMQSLAELMSALASPCAGGGVHLEKSLLFFPDGTIWRFSVTALVVGSTPYTQVLAANVTDLYTRRQELEEDSLLLRKMSQRIRSLADNVRAAAREEELLNIKMRVHDELGRSLIATRQLFVQERSMEDAADILPVWRHAVAALQAAIPAERDQLAELITDAQYMGVRLELQGELPREPKSVHLLAAILRECLTNAVRHAGAVRVDAELTRRDGLLRVQVTNDGDAPYGDVTEGGGLSALRRRVERSGGTMTLESMPAFRLTAQIPDREEDVT